MNNIPAQILFVLSYAIGGGSMLLFTVFMFAGSSGVVVLDMDALHTLAFDAALSLLFFLQHSLLVRRGVRARLPRRVPREYFGALYSVGSGVVLIPVIALWQEVPPPVFRSGIALWWALRAVFVLSGACFLWAITTLRSFDPRTGCSSMSSGPHGSSRGRCSKSVTFQGNSARSTGATRKMCPCSSPSSSGNADARITPRRSGGRDVDRQEQDEQHQRLPEKEPCGLYCAGYFF